jgi:hypothetical protein
MPSVAAAEGNAVTRLTPDVATRLAELLIAGRSAPECATELQCGVRSVWTWKRSALVLAELERLANRSDDVRAVDVLLGLLDSADERVRLAAAQEVLRARIQRTPVEPEPPAEPPEAPPGYITIPVEMPKFVERA